GTKCYIINSNGKKLSHNKKGELVVQGPHVTSGYWKRNRLTNKKFVIPINEDEKTLYTGDICSIDEDGYIYFYGRKDDMYKQNGFRLSPLEIEEKACSIDQVDQAALVFDSNKNKSVLFVKTLLSKKTVWIQ